MSCNPFSEPAVASSVTWAVTERSVAVRVIDAAGTRHMILYLRAGEAPVYRRGVVMRYVVTATVTVVDRLEPQDPVTGWVLEQLAIAGPPAGYAWAAGALILVEAP